MRARCLAVLLLALAVPPKPPVIAAAKAENWPNWRGPSRNGISRETNLPLKWSRTENVAWTLAMPSFSGSTPVIWADRVFLNVADALLKEIRA